MSIRIAINGYGRIGRNILRVIYESQQSEKYKVVAINDLGDASINAHLTTYDTTHGRFPGEVWINNEGNLVVNGDEIIVLQERDPRKLPWKNLDIDRILVQGFVLFFDHKMLSHH
jgi:glyceraldehyde 3-phosphate dehydrogenase